MSKEETCFLSPRSGDVWTPKQRDENRRLIIIDRYLKNQLIIVIVDGDYSNTEMDSKLLNLKTFTDLRIIDKEEFKLIVLKNTTMEEGFSATVQPLFLKDSVEKFKQDN